MEQILEKKAKLRSPEAKARHAAYCREWTKANEEKVKNQKSESYQRNKERYAKAQKERYMQNIEEERAKLRARYLANKEERIRKVREYQDANPDKKLGWQVSKYGLTAEEFKRISAEQEGLCKICHNPPTKTRLSVDHNHKTNKFRGLLCDNCNILIGLAKESIETL